jgi:hypothetical protein
LNSIKTVKLTQKKNDKTFSFPKEARKPYFDRIAKEKTPGPGKYSYFS